MHCRAAGHHLQARVGDAIMKTLYADFMLALMVRLFKYWLRTKQRMRAMVKFIVDYRWYRSRGHTMRSAYFLARNTL